MPSKNAHLTPRTSLPGVGEIAPNFTLADQDRKDWTLSDAVKQGDVVLCFVPFAFTGVCSTEMGCISKDIATWTKKGATVVSIDCDSMFANKAWGEKDGYTHTMLSDQLREVSKAYGLYWSDLNVSTRGTVVIAKNAQGMGKIKFIQAREPGKAMDWESVLAMV